MLVLEERNAGLLLQPREPYCSGWTMFVALTLITCATKKGAVLQLRELQTFADVWRSLLKSSIVS